MDYKIIASPKLYSYRLVSRWLLNKIYYLYILKNILDWVFENLI